MPTVLTCVFEGGDISSDASEKMQERAKRRGEKQRVNSGDAVEDDITLSAWAQLTRLTEA